MSPQTETKTGAGFKAGVKDYRLTYYTPDYQVSDTDILDDIKVDVMILNQFLEKVIST